MSDADTVGRVDGLQRLRERMAELSDLAALEMLATWDQMVMMPSAGAEARAHQLGALSRLAHERATGADIGEWLAVLDDAQLGDLDRDIVRIARREWERSRSGQCRRPRQLAPRAGERRFRQLRARPAAKRAAGARVRKLPGRGSRRRLSRAARRV